MNAFAIGWLQVLQNCMCMKALTLRKMIVKKGTLSWDAQECVGNLIFYLNYYYYLIEI